MYYNLEDKEILLPKKLKPRQMQKCWSMSLKEGAYPRLTTT